MDNKMSQATIRVPNSVSRPPPLTLALAHFLAIVALFQCAEGVANHSSVGGDEVIVRGPIALYLAGPQEDFSVNTTAIGAPLLVLEWPMSYFCDPVRNDDVDIIRGKTVMVEWSYGGCSPETSYAHLAEAGAQVVMVADPSEGYTKDGPGVWYSSRGHDMRDNVRAARQPVSMLQISVDMYDQLRELAEVAAPDNEIHLIVESTPNVWTKLFESAKWFAVMRVGVPLTHLLVFVTPLSHIVCLCLVCSTGYISSYILANHILPSPRTQNCSQERVP